jgi:A/G-specific adenine glycosylase
MSPKSTPAPASTAQFRRRLLRWYRHHARDLPWRRTRDPYRVMVSEFMLQQTQVSRVELFYPRFLERYPTIHHLARARASQVRETWEGLGYYRRATNLHRLARVVVEELDGIIPDDPERLRRLPGVGRYTAGAVACFAYERPEATVDTNVARVIRRAYHPRLKRPGSGERIWATALAVVPPRGRTAWAFNQALMELGATVCTARVARCEICPVREVCKTGRGKGEKGKGKK